VPEAASAWETAHKLNAAAAAATGASVVVEPDFVQQWPYANPLARDGAALAAAGREACVFNDQLHTLPRVDGAFAWHLGDAFSQLRQARAAAHGGPVIRVAHLDTGFDPQHQTRPAQLREDLQRNFVDDQPPNDAHDPGVRHPLENPGHGTGTLSLLAGSRFTYNKDGYAFDDVLGGAP
jgi:hypothetical protein